MALTADQLIQEIETMTVLELATLVKALEERFGVSAAAVSAAPAGGAAVAVEEQTEFNVELTEAGAAKLNVIKAVREIVTGLGLKEGFGIVEVLGSFAMLFLLAVGFASLFTTIALAVENQETLFGVINLINLPLMFASAALFPTALMPDWLKGVAEYNPLTLAADGLRQLAFVDAAPIHSMWFNIIGLLLFSGALISLSVLTSRRLLSNR